MSWLPKKTSWLSKLWYYFDVLSNSDSEQDIPKCTCGSGMHPRRCEKHPWAYETHCLGLNYDVAREELDGWEKRLAELKNTLYSWQRELKSVKTDDMFKDSKWQSFVEGTVAALSAAIHIMEDEPRIEVDDLPL